MPKLLVTYKRERERESFGIILIMFTLAIL